ncbi:MAG: hypothetical protein ACYS5V_01045 [Planctomycetota bacterium]|jgi:rubrerythrin
MITFNADEVFEMAEQIERNGAAFYRKAAAGAASSRAATLEKLAAMEDDHEKTFHQIRTELASEGKLMRGFDPEGESARYLQAMVDGKVFDFDAEPAGKLTGGESVEEILQTAIGLEKDSIVFYLVMKESVPAGAARDAVDQIIAQEVGHIAMLSAELAAVGS